jgi:hypothetical protein
MSFTTTITLRLAQYGQDIATFELHRKDGATPTHLHAAFTDRTHVGLPLDQARALARALEAMATLGEALQ